MENLGIKFSSPKADLYVPEIDTRSNAEQTFSEILTKTTNVALALFINHDKTSAYADAYADFRRVTDQKAGVQSLCLVHATIDKQKKGLQQYMANVAMKANLKLGNINHAFTPSSEVDAKGMRDVLSGSTGVLDTIILGADVTHAPPGSADNTPSLAAVVGSVDQYFGKFLGSMRHQDKNTEVWFFLTPSVQADRTLDHQRFGCNGLRTPTSLAQVPGPPPIQSSVLSGWRRRWPILHSPQRRD
jgi:hypothetical protein